MVVFFTEDDLINFGQYVRSTERKLMLRQKYSNISEAELDSMLQKITKEDIGNWIYLLDQASNEQPNSAG